jgi:hypothetical protein
VLQPLQSNRDVRQADGCYPVKPGWADFVWEKIARATAAGHLGCSANFPTRDFRSVRTTLAAFRWCFQVLDLDSLEKQPGAMGLKIGVRIQADIFTELGIGSKRLEAPNYLLR